MRKTRAWVAGGWVLVVAAALPSIGCASRAEPPAAPAIDRTAVTSAVALALDDMHDAAAKADEARYFARFADDAVFLGTDATERWDVAAFRAYAHPRFAAGKAWSFRAVRRVITLADDGRLAWFDEDLATAGLGPARGSGVVALRDGTWKVLQYNLALTIPNERFAQVRALLDRPPAPAPPSSFAERSHAAYEHATDALAHGELSEAEHALGALVVEAESRGGDDAFWLHNQLTWLRWARGDLAGAYIEVDAAKSVFDRTHPVPDPQAARTGLHEKWDRAYLLREFASTAQAALRPALVSAANAARADYERAATPLDDHDGMAVLAAFFAVRAHDPKGALAAAKRVDVEKDDDLQDLYVLALAYDLGGDRKTADAIRDRIRHAKEYLMKPIILRQIVTDAERTPAH